MSSPPRRRARLDLVVVDRGLAPSRERARALILAGQVRVDGQVVAKAGTPVAARAEVELVAPDHPYVSRGGVKLAHALDAFDIAVTGRRALDIGASTGGFTDVLLRRGAASVVALDVGRGQLDWSLRTDPRVMVRERVNARGLSRDDLPHAMDLITIDVSFISLRHILPVLLPLLAPAADVVALVKPQFEAGRGEVGKGGLVTNPATHEAVLERIVRAAESVGFECRGTVPSPITGSSGNREFLLHLQPARAREESGEHPGNAQI
jgi:23S rRNA (cytidine1920-2'-O)/16S rRNA (cytidine1409-2'-O)-methyltransferase